MAEKNFAQSWYVYTYANPDTEIIFYIGKGTGPRMFAHETEARCGCFCFKCDIIRSIWVSGKAVKKAIVFETFVEEEAYQYESALISEHAATLANERGIPEEVKKERDLKMSESRYRKKAIALFMAGKPIPNKTPEQPAPKTNEYAAIRAAYEYCELGPGIFIHYGKLFGLEQCSEGEMSNYKESDLLNFKAWMRENYPLVGTARRELLEREKQCKERDAQYAGIDPELRILRGF